LDRGTSRTSTEDRDNFADKEEDFAEVIRRIDAQINGLF